MPQPVTPALRPERLPWLEEFYAGSRAAMDSVYRDHFASVERSVGRVLHGADQETVVHEVFFRLLSDVGLRASFRGGSMRAWISTVARNHAIDYRRRQDRERPAGTAEDLGESTGDGEGPGNAARFEASVEAKELVARFRDEWLPDKWRAVFELRFIQQLPQAEASRTLGIHRTTLLYQELRVRLLLRKFVLKTEGA